jgi:hypothetical protein
VKKELPDATVRFATIDKEVKEVLKKFKEAKNAVDCCNSEVCTVPACLPPLFSQIIGLGRAPSWAFQFSRAGHSVLHLSRILSATLLAPCAAQGLMKFLEKQQRELEICEKALADYMESKRRAFPRWGGEPCWAGMSWAALDCWAQLGLSG